MNSTLLTAERPAGSPHTLHASGEHEPNAESARPGPEGDTSACDPGAELHRAAAERRAAQLVAQRARAQHEALRAAAQANPRMF